MTRQLKEKRHELSEALASLTRGNLEARETTRDVGTSVSTARENERRSLVGVVEANCKRLQEALRSLEEYGKIHNPSLARRIETLRYDSYTLERVILLGVGSRQRLADVRLYVLLTGSLCTRALDWTIKEAAAGGARMFQLREKDLPDRLLLERARQVRRWTRQEGALFIMNDRPDIGLLAEADGVHVGQEELPVKEVRRILGPEGLVGVSTHRLPRRGRPSWTAPATLASAQSLPRKRRSFRSTPVWGSWRDVIRDDIACFCDWRHRAGKHRPSGSGRRFARGSQQRGLRRGFAAHSSRRASQKTPELTGHGEWVSTGLLLTGACGMRRVPR